MGQRLQSKGHIASASLFLLVENNSSASLWQILPELSCQVPPPSNKPPKFLPVPGQLSNYRCKLGVCERLPNLSAPSPVNRNLPMTLRFVSCFNDLRPESCEIKSHKCRSFESHGPNWHELDILKHYFEEENNAKKTSKSVL